MKIKKAFFMFRRLITDFSDHRNMEIELSQKSSLGYYYIKFKESEINTRGGNKPFKFDDQGVPQIHSYIDVEKPGYYYYPITIGQYALAIYHSYLESQSEEKKAHFLKIADWFVTSAIYEERLGIYWLSDVDKPEFEMYEPWKSAFSQSRGISILLRAWQITGDIKYYDIAKNAMEVFLWDIEEGGVRVGKEGAFFYEEYVAAKPTRILDGFIFSLFGIYDMMRCSEGIDPETFSKARSIFNNGIVGLRHWLPRFDMGYWMYYNRCELDNYPQNDPCTMGYLRLVMCQLRILHGLTAEKSLREYHDLLGSYLKPGNIVKMYIEKYKALKALNRL